MFAIHFRGNPGQFQVVTRQLVQFLESICPRHMAAQPEPVAMAVQPELGFEVIKQHPGPVQVSRKVLVNVPGKHFPNLQAAEQRREYPGSRAHRSSMRSATGSSATQGRGEQRTKGRACASFASRTLWTTRTTRASGSHVHARKPIR